MFARAHGIQLIALAAVLVVAAAAGLAVGNLLNEGRATSTNAGYPEGWSGGAAIPVNKTGTVTFSQSALDAVRITRGDEAVAGEREAVDYFRLHPEFRAEPSAGTRTEVESDYHQRHPELRRHTGADDATTAPAPKGIPQHVE